MAPRSPSQSDRDRPPARLSGSVTVNGWGWRGEEEEGRGRVEIVVFISSSRPGQLKLLTVIIVFHPPRASEMPSTETGHSPVNKTASSRRCPASEHCSCRPEDLEQFEDGIGRANSNQSKISRFSLRLMFNLTDRPKMGGVLSELRSVCLSSSLSLSD